MRILAISPHADDVELGAGGTVARWVEEKHDVVHLALSLGAHGTGATEAEYLKACMTLGVTAQLEQFECRKFFEWRQSILDRLIVAQEEWHPVDRVLVPARGSIHQDHQIVTQEALRAFRRCSILGYEMPWGDVLGFHPQLFVKLSTDHADKKKYAVSRYKSQHGRVYTLPGMMDSLLRVRGMQIGVGFAEAFEVLRWVM